MVLINQAFALIMYICLLLQVHTALSKGEVNTPAQNLLVVIKVHTVYWALEMSRIVSWEETNF